ncbi:hypothetical protein [Paenibacillus cremeus]|uniref:Uncharacterized protein n=1 Tax=Paenibacillus cremeus TaxID=2163881 RepID=A0A559KBK7_9BACL|nr:hypothetical protein [Paenibacillus cremeus]TVY09483.1 hypothetical protein FPZ49_13675 [Paenibacillus cremeus]
MEEYIVFRMVIALLKDLILNFVIIGVFLFFVSPFVIREQQGPEPSIAQKIYIGALFGVLGVGLLFLSINVNHKRTV